MTVKKHPATGVMLNALEILRTNPLNDAEKRTGRLLQEEGAPRWLAAAQLGCHPLTIDGVTRPLPPQRRPRGKHLSIRDARNDPRQTAMEDLFFPTDSNEDGKE